MQLAELHCFFCLYLRWLHSLVQPEQPDVLRQVNSRHVLRMITATTTTATAATTILCQSITPTLLIGLGDNLPTPIAMLWRCCIALSQPPTSS